MKIWAESFNDSTRILFRQSQSTIDHGYGDNSAELERLKERLQPLRKSPYQISRLHVEGSASPEGSMQMNHLLSEKRANSVFEYFKEFMTLPDSVTRFTYTGRDWKKLYELVEKDNEVPARAEVLVIISPAAKTTEMTQELSDRTLTRLKKLRNGVPYRYLYENLFPQLRASKLYITYADVLQPYCIPEGMTPELGVFACGEAQPGSVGPGVIRLGLPDRYRRKTDGNWALKTNLIFDALLLPNLELEWLFHPLWSVCLEGDVAWWSRRDHDQFYQLAMVSPEVRRWINPRQKWHGMFVGLFAGGGLYDLCKGYDGYRGEGAMGGLSIGYMFPVWKKLSFEASLGAGYLFTKYKEYRPQDGHKLYLRTKNIHYFGPLKLKFSLVWRFAKSKTEVLKELSL